MCALGDANSLSRRVSFSSRHPSTRARALADCLPGWPRAVGPPKQVHGALSPDATRRGVLEAANIDTAAVVVALLNSQPRLEQLVRQVRQLNPALPVLVSTRDNRGLTSIAKAGATYIFPENLAAGLGLAVQTFVALGVSPEEALARVRAVRLRLNPELRALRTI
ncbi:NAD-binding protein [Sphingomonas sp. 179-A 2A2 NHS]|uniref:NAD-binding protein n=1 Tax=Sphingomonas sp. 179-A 2A2 NHS TaxID=3374290 RepID=UPI00387950AE